MAHWPHGMKMWSSTKPEEDNRAMVTGNMHNKIWWISAVKFSDPRDREEVDVDVGVVECGL